MSDETGGPERRRLPRVNPGGTLECRLALRTRVRLLDISLTGALLQSDTRLPAGTRAHLRAGVGASPFAPEVLVQRSAERDGTHPILGVGTIFVGMDEASRRSLEGFLRKASE
jgi:hypothetical protein